MKYFRKRKLLKHLKELLADANSHDLQFYLGLKEVRQSDEFLSWKEKTSLALEHAFGSASEQKKRFDDLDFNFGGDPHRDLFYEHMSRGRAILEASVYRIQSFGIPKDTLNKQSLRDDISRLVQRTPSKKSFWEHTLTKTALYILAGIVVFVLGGYWSDYRQAVKDAATPNETYKQVEVSFYNWMEDYDRTLIPGCVRLAEDAARRGVLLSGEAATHAIQYFQEFRRKRDNTLDSFLVAYALAGGDTLDLKFKRKLPIDVKSRVESQWRDLGKEFGQYIQRFRLDTL